MRRRGQGDIYSFKKVLSVPSVANQSQVTTHQNITNGAQAHFHDVFNLSGLTSIWHILLVEKQICLANLKMSCGSALRH